MGTLSETFPCDGSDVTVSTTQKEGESFKDFEDRHKAVVAKMKAAC